MTAPDGSAATLEVSVLRHSAPRDVSRDSADPGGLVIARFLSPATRARLEALDRQYLDLTGNIRMSLSRPGLVVRTRGADRDPAPRTLPQRTLRGPRAARLVRVLCDAPMPIALTDLGRRARIDLGYASRLLDWMVREQFIARQRRGPVTSVDIRALVSRWATVYQVLQSNHALAFRDPASAASSPDRMTHLPTRYAITGTFAANKLAVFAPRRPMLIFTDAPRDAAAHLGLVTAGDDPDVILLDPFDDIVFERSWITGGLVFASPSQIAVDLLTGPEPGRAFADDVLAWLARRAQT